MFIPPEIPDMYKAYYAGDLLGFHVLEGEVDVVDARQDQNSVNRRSVRMFWAPSTELTKDYNSDAAMVSEWNKTTALSNLYYESLKSLFGLTRVYKHETTSENLAYGEILDQHQLLVSLHGNYPLTVITAHGAVLESISHHLEVEESHYISSAIFLNELYRKYPVEHPRQTQIPVIIDSCNQDRAGMSATIAAPKFMIAYRKGFASTQDRYRTGTVHLSS